MLPDSVLVLSPHPDDEVIGAGGLIHRVSQGGLAVVSYGHVGDIQRMREAEASTVALGAIVSLLRDANDDSWMDSGSLAPLVGVIEDRIECYRPQCVLIPDPGGFHQEHRAVAEAAMAAMRPSGSTDRWRPPIVACFEEPSDSWRIAEPMRPTWYVALSERDMLVKRQAMMCHESQMRNWPSERSLQAIDALARLRGAQAGVEYAEAFTLLRWLS